MRPAAFSGRTGVFNRNWLGADFGQACFVSFRHMGVMSTALPQSAKAIVRYSMRSAFQDRVIEPDNPSD